MIILESEFVELLRRHLRYAGDQPITSGSVLRDLGLDSMQSIELLFDIEDSYQLSIPDEHLTDATFATAGSLWSIVDQERAGAEGSGQA